MPPPRPEPTQPAIIWSIAGLDTAGGAGLSADQRAADAFDARGVHLCPVAACLTAQHSRGVEAIFPVDAAQLEAQLQALAQDMPPRAIKTGLLGSVAAIETVARWVDRLRANAPTGTDPHRHLALVVDPVLRASAGGAAFTDEAIVEAYRHWLLPRATVITPNRQEAIALLGKSYPVQTPPQAFLPDAADALSLIRETSEPFPKASAFDAIPDIAAALQALGPRTVLITGGDAVDTSSGTHPAALSGTHPGTRPNTNGHHDASHGVESRFSLDWLQSPEAEGWLCAPRLETPHHHGTGCTLASAIAAALATGHVSADACVLGRMVVHHALMHARPAGAGRGPVIASAGALAGPALGGAPVPWLGLGRELPWRLMPGISSGAPARFPAFHPPADRLYGILPDGPALAASVEAGLRCVQLRHKPLPGADTALAISLRAAAHHGATLFVNDHWRLALATPRPTPGQAGSESELAHCHPRFQLGIHLGQEDLLALSADDRAALRQRRHDTLLGLSSHCPWELARALGCGPSYVACGPVQATTTKDMPWLPQGEDNLRWWVAQADVPVVAIGGLLGADDLRRFAACGPAALCVVRALHTEPAALPTKLASLRQAARQATTRAAAAAPHPCLPRS